MQTRRWLVMVLSLTVLATSVGPVAAQSTNAPKRTIDKTSPILMQACRVTKVDDRSRTFTVERDGKEYTFSGTRLRYLPAVGQVLDVSYTQTGGGGLLEATNVNSRSN
jgi:hypothetical protein